LCTGKRAAFVAEDVAFRYVRRVSGAIDPQVWGIASWADFVNQPR